MPEPEMSKGEFVSGYYERSSITEEFTVMPSPAIAVKAVVTAGYM